MNAGVPLEYEMHWPSLREPTQARQVPVAEVLEVLASVSAARAGTAARSHSERAEGGDTPCTSICGSHI